MTATTPTRQEMALRRQVTILQRRLAAAEDVVDAARGYCHHATLATCVRLERAVLAYDDPETAGRVRPSRFDLAAS